MNPSPTASQSPITVDEDLIEQAHSGYGVPSQDPASAAQFPLTPEDTEREANSVLTGGGMVAGAATGAAIGAVVAGPVGVVLGGSLGAVAGVLGAAAMMSRQDSTTEYAAPADAVRPTAQVNQVISASAPEIWTALTTPAALKQFFFGADVVTTWKVGSPIRMKGVFKGQTYEDKGDIVTFDPPRQLRFSHWSAMSGQADTPANYHLVTFDLAPEGATTKVTLSQANLTGGVTASDIEHRAEYEKNWASVLDGLAKVVMHERLT